MNTASVSGTGCINIGGAFGTADLITFAPSVTTITLLDVVNNHILVTVPALTINGGAGVIMQRALSHVQPFRIINHTGTGRLSLIGMTITRGRITTASQTGGGVRTSGSLSLTDSTIQGNVTSCNRCSGGGAHADGALFVENSLINSNVTTGDFSAGGGLSSFTGADIRNSEVSFNATGGRDSFGGGISAGNSVSTAITLISSLIISNQTAHPNSSGGGAYANGGLNVINSFVTDNVTRTSGGGIYVSSGAASIDSSTFSDNRVIGDFPDGGALYLAVNTITNSTISGNAATSSNVNAGSGGGIWASQQLALRNTTLYGNSTTGLGGGIALNAIGATLSMNSTIISGSTSQSAASSGPSVDIFSNSLLTVSGANNLVRSVQNLTLPAGTLITSDPLLAALAVNGCATPAGRLTFGICPGTHALGVGSPAINTGNNVVDLTNDQRGSGYPRVLGIAADMGAIEMPAAAVITGACGSATSTAQTTVPTLALCSTGTPSSVTSTNTNYTWTCAGSGGGSNASCTTARHYVVSSSVPGGNGSISANQTIAYNAQATFILTPNAGFAPTSAGGTCGGTLSGNSYTTFPITQNCTVIASFASTVNGACGLDNNASLTSTPTNLCSTGTPSSITTGSNNWSWSCDGINGGSTATCSAIRTWCHLLLRFPARRQFRPCQSGR